METLLGWANPYIEGILNRSLYGHWKHLFVLMGVYFFRDAEAAINAGARLTATFRMVLGFLIAFVFSAVAGTIPDLHGNGAAAFLTALLPLIGMLAFNSCYSIWAVTVAYDSHIYMPNRLPKRTAQLRRRIFSDLREFLFLTIVVLLIISLPFAKQMSGSGTVALFVAVLLKAILFIIDGYRWGKIYGTPDDSWYRKLTRSGDAVIGISMLGAFFWALLFVLANAGLIMFDL